AADDYSVLIHASGENFLRTLELLPAGIVLLHLREDAEGLAILPRLLARNIAWPIVIMTSDGAGRTVFRTLRLGVLGPFGTAAEVDLLGALKAATDDPAERAVSVPVAESLPARLRRLSVRER